MTRREPVTAKDGRCNACGSHLHQNNDTSICESCEGLAMDTDDTVEIPAATVERLMDLAGSRHPDACHEVAPRVEEKIRATIEDL